MTNAPFTYPELDEVLRGDGHNDFIGISAIDGLIAALVAGPVFVPKERWLPAIFAGHLPSAIEGSPENRAAATIMARYAEVEHGLSQKPPSYQPMFMHHLGRIITTDWATGFMMGLAQGGDAWRPLGIGPWRNTLAPIFASSDLGRRMLPEMSVSVLDRIADAAAPQIASVVAALWLFNTTGHRTKRPPTSRQTAIRQI
jgi:yecA family protein